MDGTAAPNPWLSIPASDYEGHMASPGVGQLQYLNGLFRDLLKEFRPVRLAVLGCATGNGFEHIDPGVTRKVTGIDINGQYLEVLRERFSAMIPGLELIAADLVQCDFEPASFDLVHCALVLEYLDPGPLIQKIADWLRPDGILSVLLQLPSEGGGRVSETKYTSLKRLEDIMDLVEPESVRRLAETAGLLEVRSKTQRLASGKAFLMGIYRKDSHFSFLTQGG